MRIALEKMKLANVKKVCVCVCVCVCACVRVCMRVHVCVRVCVCEPIVITKHYCVSLDGQYHFTGCVFISLHDPPLIVNSTQSCMYRIGCRTVLSLSKY